MTADTFLGGQVRVDQPVAGFRSGLDAVMLAAAVPAMPGQSALELGSGAGTATLCLAARVSGLALTGVEPAQVRNTISEPDFLAGMLDFLMNHEPTLLAFCEASGISPEAVAAASAHFSPPGLASGEY